MKYWIFFIGLQLVSLCTTAQDSVIFELSDRSKVIFAIEPEDLETFKQYDFQELMNDMIIKLESADTTALNVPPAEYVITPQADTPEGSALDQVRNEEELLFQELEQERNRLIQQLRAVESAQSQTRANEQVLRQQEQQMEAESQQEQAVTNQVQSQQVLDQVQARLMEDIRNLEREQERLREEFEETRSGQNNQQRRRRDRTSHTVKLDVGINNYLSDQKFPDRNEAYALYPLTSWYAGMNWVQRTHIGGILYMEWGAGASWNNFQFQNREIRLVEDNLGVAFTSDGRGFDYKRSKFSAIYLNASFVPMLDFGWRPNGYDQSFRIGAGPYVGYRLDSFTKQVYKIEGDKQKERYHNDFYLNTLRYGIRVQVGLFDHANLFVNYDLNDLFIADKGPKLNAFSFGISF